MTDPDMLRKCLEAFRAMATADDAHRFILQRQATAYRGTTGQHKLRNYMIDDLERHLGIGRYSA